MVGAVRFELTTSCTRNKRATRLRYAPNRAVKVPRPETKCNHDLAEFASRARVCRMETGETALLALRAADSRRMRRTGNSSSGRFGQATFSMEAPELSGVRGL